jgi:diguanylate cyclase
MEAANAKLQVQLQAMLEEIAWLRREIDIIRNESLTDALTSLGNRKYFNAALKTVAASHARTNPCRFWWTSIISRINDDYGHVVGDRVPRFVATILQTLKAAFQPLGGS